RSSYSGLTRVSPKVSETQDTRVKPEYDGNANKIKCFSYIATNNHKGEKDGKHSQYAGGLYLG
ncbi:hypothetical protein, partial [Neisseria canis]|uniref:hypothetical protein n=1 Tax=Neisseria canis TaxID=493 RepID=UPI0027DFE680